MCVHAYIYIYMYNFFLLISKVAYIMVKRKKLQHPERRYHFGMSTVWGYKQVVNILIKFSLSSAILWHMVWFPCLYGISIFMGYLMPKPPWEKNSSHIIIIHTKEDNRVHTFPIGIGLKVKVFTWLKLNLLTKRLQSRILTLMQQNLLHEIQ